MTITDRLILDDPFDTTETLDRQKVLDWYKENMSYRATMQVGEKEFLTAKTEEAKKQRFGRVVKDYDMMGELRRQKKEPHTEVLYIWVSDPAKASERLKGTIWEGMILRSVNNCTNDQLTQAIKSTGLLVDRHEVDQADAEVVLDLLYKSLQTRVENKNA